MGRGHLPGGAAVIAIGHPRSLFAGVAAGGVMRWSRLPALHDCVKCIIVTKSCGFRT
ncbi:hypothetical protein HMPREF9946_04874 [Acetobacteraceae bacterium AT-5844]|nr:hypothetical protein HMPREF9946_04874 [Acetobacteraceae bacterium AT-5844]